MCAALSNLVCASLTEDPYGVAQRDIPKVLEAFVRYLAILDSVAAEMQSAAEQAVGGREEQERARQVVEREIGEVQGGASAPDSHSLTLSLSLSDCFLASFADH